VHVEGSLPQRANEDGLKTASELVGRSEASLA
jgi:hypothetical protein